ncbi:hypothetical protein HO133_006486 [Letharia lupina]|uniref:Tubulin nucleotide-binding domain-like protein n=1 Tax=Letharia lupina TaxID=560253 RepID=A0A8H6F812_9LECA|nr:uncharacterized protein HO133_006486 [Letharia lupina]KAF6218074.1 hypothetical protein HO133_006486 [Letharia lupina]
MHEILTIQLGHRANYVATHFWNTQESYFTYDSTQASPVDHDVHFRPGIGARGEETYTPRTLIYDLKGGFGGLRKWGGLYDQQISGDGGVEQGKGVWDGNVVLHQDPGIEQSEFQRSLDEGVPSAQKLSTETVRYWSDFNRVFYHPRSIVQINDYELGSTLMPFEKWESGEELFTSMDRDVDLLDRDVRVWAEECDQMQGIQVFTGGDDAWSAFAAKYVESLRDEFGKVSIWTWGFEEEQGKGQKAKQLLRTVNAARMISEMSTHASMYIPLSIPPTQLPQYVHFDRTSQWHTSALLSAALESITLPTRLRHDTQKRGFLDNLEGALNVHGNHRIAQLRCSMLDPETAPLVIATTHGTTDDRAPSANNGTLVEEDGLKLAEPRLDMDLSCCNARSTSPFATQHDVSDHVFGVVETTRTKVEAARDEEAEEGEITYARKRRRFAGLPVIERYHSSLECPILDSFPPILSFSPGLTQVAVHTSLSTTSGISNRVKALQRVVSRMANLDERETLSNGLGQISEAYENGWHSGSDESDD